MVADDDIHPRVSLCKTVQRLVVGEGRADEHDVTELAAEGPRSWLTSNRVLPELVGPTTSALNGMFFGSKFLKRYRFKLIFLNVKLTIGDHEDLAVDSPRAGGGPLKLQLDAVGGVHQARAAAVHGPVGHGAEIDQQPELVPGQEHLQIHVLCFIFFFHEKAAGLRPEVGADDTFVVKHVRRAVDCDSDFGQVGENVFFRVTRARRIRLREQKAFIDLLWAFTFMFIRVSESLLTGIVFSRCTWS